MSKCFIVMPISTPSYLLGKYNGDSYHFKHVLDHLFLPAIKKAELEPISPIMEGSDVIHAQIIENIEKCDLVLCDMSALNPNVFFELGIRTAVDKPVSMVVDDITNNVPFDTSIVNYHRYKSSLNAWELEEEINTLCEHILAVKKNGERNPLWNYFGLNAKAKFSANETSMEAKIDLLRMEVEGLRNSESKKSVKTAVGVEQLLFNELFEISKLCGFKFKGAFLDDNNLDMIITSGEMPGPEICNKMGRIAAKYAYALTISENRGGTTVHRASFDNIKKKQ